MEKWAAGAAWNWHEFPAASPFPSFNPSTFTSMLIKSQTAAWRRWLDCDPPLIQCRREKLERWTRGEKNGWMESCEKAAMTGWRGESDGRSREWKFPVCKLHFTARFFFLDRVFQERAVNSRHEKSTLNFSIPEPQAAKIYYIHIKLHLISWIMSTLYIFPFAFYNWWF